jgi:hypothetical protein
MADDSSNDVGEGGDVPEIADYEETTPAIIADATTTSVLDDYDDEPIEDYVVKLVVNEQPDGVSPLVDAAITDIYGNPISSKTTLIDSINGYTTAVYDELSGNGTAATGGKGWWGKFVNAKINRRRLGKEAKKKTREI